MRRSVLLSFVVVLALSALALWWPERQAAGSVVAAADLPGPRAQAAGTESRASSGERAAVQPVVPRGTLDKARFDPFVGELPPAPASAQVSEPKPFVGPLYVPPPSPPALNYRYLGRMTDPAGQQLVYLAAPGQHVAVSVGTRLDDGYVVEAITGEAVRLHYPPLGAHVEIPLPVQADVAGLSPKPTQ